MGVHGVAVDGVTLGRQVGDRHHVVADEPARLTRVELHAVYRSPEVHVFKEDRRSRVWAVDHEGRRYVVKRYEYPPWRQAAARAMRCHPAHREVRAARWLSRQGVAVVPVLGVRQDRGRVYTVTRYIGPTLVRIGRGEAPPPATGARGLAEAVGGAIASLLAKGIFFRDLKTSNVLVDRDGAVWLIDTGSARRSWRPRHAVRMIAMLERTATRDGVSPRHRLRALRAAAKGAQRLGGFRPLAQQVGRVAARS